MVKYNSVYHGAIKVACLLPKYIIVGTPLVTRGM